MKSLLDKIVNRLKSTKLNRASQLVVYFLPLLIIIILVVQADTSWSFSWPKLTPKEKPEEKEEETSLAWLKTSGRFIVDDTGQPVILRGVNLASLSWGYHDWFPEAIQVAVEDWGVNVIRTRIYQDDYFANPEVFFTTLEDTIINPAGQYGVYVILNPWIGQNESLPNEQTITFWQAVASRYRNNPTVIYDILAEPHDVSRDQVWQANQSLIKTIRQVHPDSLIMVTGIGWGREINSYLDNPLPYKNIVYRTNPYNKTGEFEAIFGQIARYYPVFIGEFGADGYPPMTQVSVQALLNLADKLALGWTAWNFHSVGCPCLLSDYQDFSPSSYGQIVKTALGQRANLIPANLTTTNTNQQLTIYSDYLENNFRDLSWDAEVDLINQKEIFSGQNAIKINITQAWGALFLSSYLPINSNDFSQINFAIKTDNLNRYHLAIADSGGIQSNEVSLSSFAKIVSGGWYQIIVPLSTFTGINGEIISLSFKDALGQPSSFWVDDIYLN
jgi:endoglucanase